MLERFRLASMRGQIFLLATLPIFLFATVAAIRAPLKEIRHERSEWASFVAGEILALASQIQSGASEGDGSTVAGSGGYAGLAVELRTRNPGEDFDFTSRRRDMDRRGSLVAKLLELVDLDQDDHAPVRRALTVRIADERWVVFSPDIPHFSSNARKVLQSLGAIGLVVLPVLFLSYFLSYRFTRPVVEFAAAAQRITLDEDSRESFSARGTLEIRSLGASLNAMRERVNRMIEERTRIIYGVGHDLRTPLTRLRMRAERGSDPELRGKMLRDVDRLAGMIDDMMLYLRNLGTDTVSFAKVDLSGLLQTIAADYADMGVSVSFSGPRRLVYMCKVRGMTRAISNLIDNASRYADNIELVLAPRNDGGIFVEVRDDGPGLSDELKRKVLEPFFKVDAARTHGEGSGIGLGLPIASGVARIHGGMLSLLDNEPRGLCARVALPPGPSGLASPDPASAMREAT
ncbi:HAMP domain-containing sensor histidine kinase [Bradyrhizobium sp. CCGB01]|uniref:sensor histidine kinase n=1 Tax=Bradyrhizobium sp. CCGB01 TaxID=2949634 RepID=UPI0020B42062|nr:HAMP domain-containing sensor histidine kinase [Bradyrhizobium sp. CCGB01]MCP3408219.1 HAMP domain-containing histidine kinase [Bradyrhizobium sp. CCGB01]